MKKNYTLNIFLACVLGLVLLSCALLRTFLPRLILPQLDIPNMVLITLVSLVLEHYTAPAARRSWVTECIAAALCFGLLPFCASLATSLEALKLAGVGGIVFAATVWLFDTMADRISTGPAAKAAPIVSALCLYLGAQCLMGIL